MFETCRTLNARFPWAIKGSLAVLALLGPALATGFSKAGLAWGLGLGIVAAGLALLPAGEAPGEPKPAGASERSGGRGTTRLPAGAAQPVGGPPLGQADRQREDPGRRRPSPPWSSSSRRSRSPCAMRSRPPDWRARGPCRRPWEQGDQTLTGVIQELTRGMEARQLLLRQIEELSGITDQLRTMSEEVAAIANQTNLLALNAGHRGRPRQGVRQGVRGGGRRDPEALREVRDHGPGHHREGRLGEPVPWSGPWPPPGTSRPRTRPCSDAARPPCTGSSAGSAAPPPT